MLDAIVFVTQSEKGCSQVGFDSEYEQVSSACLFPYFGIYLQGYVRCENQTDKFDVSATPIKKIVKISTSNFMFIFLKERNE
jgi:hypothetical protein